MSVSPREGSPFLWCRFSLNGRRYAESTGVKVDVPGSRNWKLAERFESTLKGKILTGIVPLVGGKAPTLAEFSKRYLQHVARRVEAGTLKASSRESYEDGCLLLSRTPAWRMRLDQINRTIARELTFPGGPSSANRALRVLHAILAYAEELGILAAVPKISLREEQGRDRLMAPQEQEVILRQSPVVLRYILTIMLDCGMRPEEVCRMQWADIDWIENKILVQRGKSKKARRFVGLTQRMRQTLEACRKRNQKRGLAESPFVFATSRGKYGHIRMVQHTWGNTLTRVEAELNDKGIVLAPGLVPYCARHTYATTFLKAGGDPGQLMRLMGHSDLKTTMRYVHMIEAGGAAELMDAHHEKVIQMRRRA
jgi:integrase